MTWNLPPGISFIAPGLTKLGVLGTSFFIIRRYNVPVPSWVPLVLLPAYVVLESATTFVLEERERKALGGAPIPITKGRWPGNLDILFEVMSTYYDGYFGEQIPDLASRFGPVFDINIFGDHQVFTSELADVKALLATDFQSFEKGTKMHSAADSFLGEGVFNADGDLWKFHRQMTRPFFTRDRISDFDVFLKHSDTAISLLLNRSRQQQPLDIQDLTGCFTLDVASEFLLGCEVKALASPLPYPGQTMVNGARILAPGTQLSLADEFVRAFNEAQVALGSRLWIGDLWPLTEFWEDKTRKPMSVIGRFIDPILAQAQARYQERKGQDTGDLESGTLLDYMVVHTDDTKLIKDEILNILVAGRDTTSTTSSFVTYFLAMHPQVFEKARAEVLATLGTSRPPTSSDIKAMSYLRAVVNETLRLMPPVPFNFRQTKAGTLLASTDATGRRYYVPGRVNVTYSVWNLQRLTDLWGPDAEEFDPERWLDDRARKYQIANPFIFVPFNAGPRICLGQQFAYNVVSFFIARMLQSVQALELAPEAQPKGTLPPASWQGAAGRKGMERIVPAAHLTLYSKGGIWIKFTPA